MCLSSSSSAAPTVFSKEGIPVAPAASPATTTDVVPPLPPAAAKTITDVSGPAPSSSPDDDKYVPPPNPKRVETQRTTKVHNPVSEGKEKTTEHGKKRPEEGGQKDSSVQSPVRKSSRKR